MAVEITALVHKDYGPSVLEIMNGEEGVIAIYVESGRSDDLFEEKQFGSFGEAAIITIMADVNLKDQVFEKFFECCDLHNKRCGMIFMSHNLKSTQDMKPTLDNIEES